MGAVPAMTFEHVAFVAAAAVGATETAVDGLSIPNGQGAETVDGSVVATETSVCPDTMFAYQRDMDRFTAWCASRGEHALPAAPDVALAYLTDLLRAGRRWKGVERVSTSLNYVHRHADLPAPWPSSRALRDALEEHVPEAFAREAAGIRTSEDERRDVVRFLEWAEQQMPGYERALGFLRGYIEGGQHVDFTSISIDERFDDRGDGAESHTVCLMCGSAIATGAHATDAECRRHRCQ